MNDLQSSVRNLVLKKMQQAAQSTGQILNQVHDDYNLIESGLFDSFSFLEMLASLETELGRPIDFGDKDPGEFTTLGGLVQCLSTPQSVQESLP